MGEDIRPLPSRVKITSAEPFPSRLGISRQVCDSSGHLGESWQCCSPRFRQILASPARV